MKKGKKSRRKTEGAVDDLPLKSKTDADLFLLLQTEKKKDRKDAIKEELICRYDKLVIGLARRFKNKGEPFKDLVQVGQLGLLLAVERYDPERGVEFVSFATPTILGEIRRYFRDKGWAIRVPRRLQELNLRIHKLLPQLTQSLVRKPTPRDLARYLQVTEEDVLEAIEIGQVYSLLSLDAEFEAKPGHAMASLQKISGGLDHNLEVASAKASLREAMQHLSKRDRKILEWRFFENLTQSEIAEHLAVSQMQVSRLQKAALRRLKFILKVP